MFEKIDKFDSSKTAPAINWIKEFGRNIFREYDRENRRVPLASANKQRNAEDQTDYANLPQRTAMEEAICTEIRTAVKKLSKEHPELHAILVDFYYQGWSRVVIAERRKLPLGTVKSRLHRAEDLIRKYLPQLEGIGNSFGELCS